MGYCWLPSFLEWNNVVVSACKFEFFSFFKTAFNAMYKFENIEWDKEGSINIFLLCSLMFFCTYNVYFAWNFTWLSELNIHWEHGLHRINCSYYETFHIYGNFCLVLNENYYGFTNFLWIIEYIIQR